MESHITPTDAHEKDREFFVLLIGLGMKGIRELSKREALQPHRLDTSDLNIVHEGNHRALAPCILGEPEFEAACVESCARAASQQFRP